MPKVVLGLAIAGATVVAVTCNTLVGRDSGDRELEFFGCVVLPLPLPPLCSPAEMTWKTWFVGTGHLHGHANLQTGELTDDYYYNLHHWDQGIALYDVWDDYGAWSRPWGLTITMGNEIESYPDVELGNIAQIITYGDIGNALDVGTFPANGNNCNAVGDPADEYLCFTWDGTIDLGKPGGRGTFGAAIEAVSDYPFVVSPLPLPVDTFDDIPWYMYHVK